MYSVIEIRNGIVIYKLLSSYIANQNFIIITVLFKETLK
jgi:hypothetical protein